MKIKKSISVDEFKINFLEEGVTFLESSNFTNYELANMLGEPFKYRPEKSPYYFEDQEGFDLRVSNVNGILGNAQISWHQDHSHKKGIWYGGILRGIKNSHFSDTVFCDLEKLFNDLSIQQQKKAETIKITQSINKKYENIKEFNNLACHMDNVDYRLAKRIVERDMVILHPNRKTKILSLSPEFAILKPEDQDFFEEILDLAKNEKYHLVFKWKDGNVLAFDNLKFMHKRDSFLGDRILTRTLFKFRH
jgi:alpha-ketoglutarate-dependent taurine dioxygenase